MPKFAVTPDRADRELEKVVELQHQRGPSRPAWLNENYIAGARAALEWVLGYVEERPTEDGETEPDS